MATEMEKWLQKWVFGPFFLIFFPISVAISRPSQAGGHSPFCFPFSPDICTGPVSHSVAGHRASNSSGLSPRWGWGSLVAPYCAILRDYLSDTPLLRAMGFLVSQHGPWPIGCDTPPPFLSMSPLESMQSGGAIPPSEKGYLSDVCTIPYENKANGCDTPSAILSRKGIASDMGGGISHWAAKFLAGVYFGCSPRWGWGSEIGG